MEVLLVVLATLLCLVLAWIIRAEAQAARIRRQAAGRRGEEKIGALLDRAGGSNRLDNFLVSDGRGRSAEIDHAVLGARSIVVIEVKNWNGTLYGDPHEKTWVLTRGDGRRTELRNPISQVSRQAAIIAKAAGRGVTVQGLVVMVGRTKPASGVFPDGVVRPRELEAAVRSMLDLKDVRAAGPTDALLAAGWDRIVEIAFQPDAEKRVRRYSGSLEGRFGKKPWQAWLVASLAFSTLVCVMGVTVQTATLNDADGQFPVAFFRRGTHKPAAEPTTFNRCVNTRVDDSCVAN